MGRKLQRRWSSAGTVDSLTCFAVIGQYKHKILTLETNGLVWILVGQVMAAVPGTDPKAKDAFHKQLCTRLGKVPGGNTVSPDYKAKAAWRLADTDLTAFLSAADWILDKLQSSHDQAVAVHAANRVKLGGRVARSNQSVLVADS